MSFMIAWVLLVMVLTACSPITRYRVLSFFFDGVPPPPGVVPVEEQPAEGKELSEFQLAMAELRRPVPAAPKVVILSVHEPFKEDRCRECHDPAGVMETMPRDATLCDRCHGEQRRQEGWDHGPLNLGTCIPCHVSHQSEYEHLLSQPVPDLCLHCHVHEAELEPAERPEYHQVSNYEQCSECHDPHRMY